MSLTSPTLNELQQQGYAAARKRQPAIDPTIQYTWAGAFIDSNAANAFSLTQVIQDLAEQVFPQTANGEFLEDWGGYENLPRLAASSSEGMIAHPGVVDTVIPIGTEYTREGVVFSSTAVATVIETGLSVSSIVRSGTTATATTSANHNYGGGITVTISGADQPEYNGEFEITVTSSTTFTFIVSGSPATPATGTISSTATIANVSVQSVGTGQNSNVLGGGVLTLAGGGIVGLENQAIVTSDGLTGGAEEEDDESYRERILLSRSIIQGVFTRDQIKLAALGVAGNTRVFVISPVLKEAETITPGVEPAPGQVVVYILRDNDANILPSQTVLDNTKQAIIDNGRLPADRYEGDLYVFAPIPVSVDFEFSSITPDTPTMRTAIQDQLQAFFEDQVQFQQDITQADYFGAINNTEDLQTNTFLETFSLNAPVGDVSISNGEIGLLGSVTFV